jgi:crotonobetainyl-CoA:carnitine CoA-transferase CaiB-like acyl-CoA transferase
VGAADPLQEARRDQQRVETGPMLLVQPVHRPNLGVTAVRSGPVSTPDAIPVSMSGRRRRRRRVARMQRRTIMTQPLEGFRVVEVDSWGFAPSAGAVLADWGADVVKVEPPGRGDALRGAFGTLGFGADRLVNFMHEQWNRNKRSVALDVASTEGHAALDALVASSDVFLTNLLPEARERLRLDAADVRRVKPDIVYALATGQGSKGPDAGRASYDYVSAWARAGIGERLTPEGGPFPLQRAGIVDTTAGNFLAGAIAAALLRRERSGAPADVEVSLLAAGGWIVGPDITFALNNGFEMPHGRPDGRGAGPLFTWYECADGKRLVLTMMQPERYWPEVVRTLELGDLLADERFDTPDKRAAETDALCAVIAERMRALPRDEWARRLNASGVIWGPVQTPTEYAVDDQVLANGYLIDAPRADGRILRLAASPAQFDGDPIVGRSAAPEVGEHTDAVLRELGWDADRIAAARTAGAVG